jgi:hypothetical protein
MEPEAYLYLRCPLCGRDVRLDHKGRLDCAAGHRFVEPDLWREARTMQLVAEIKQFLDPDSAPECPAHRWVVTEVRGEFVAARCEFCPAIAVAVRPDGASEA